MADTIRTETYRDLEGRASHPWHRRLLLALLAVLPVLALFDVFGERGTTSHANAPAASLTLTGATHVRGGLYFQEKITVVAHRPLLQPTLVLNQAFFDGLTLNTIEPQASQELNRNGQVVLQYGGVKAGNRLNVWFEYQTNPTTVGTRTQRLELDDGQTRIAVITRKFRSFP